MSQKKRLFEDIDQSSEDDYQHKTTDEVQEEEEIEKSDLDQDFETPTKRKSPTTSSNKRRRTDSGQTFDISSTVDEVQNEDDEIQAVPTADASKKKDEWTDMPVFKDETPFTGTCTLPILEFSFGELQPNETTTSTTSPTTIITTETEQKNTSTPSKSSPSANNAIPFKSPVSPAPTNINISNPNTPKTTPRSSSTGTLDTLRRSSSTSVVFSNKLDFWKVNNNLKLKLLIARRQIIVEFTSVLNLKTELIFKSWDIANALVRYHDPKKQQIYATVRLYLNGPPQTMILAPQFGKTTSKWCYCSDITGNVALTSRICNMTFEKRTDFETFVKILDLLDDKFQQNTDRMFSPNVKEYWHSRKIWQKQKKDPDAHPLQEQIKHHQEMESNTPNLKFLDLLPKELWNEIISFLKPCDLFVLSRVCKFFKSLCNETRWLQVCKQQA